MQAKDISDKAVLEYLFKFQGEWTGLWYGHFNHGPNPHTPNEPPVSDVYYAMPINTPEKVALAKMKSLHKRGFVGGCTCGCRGDFEITDKGLEFIGQTRTKAYTGY